MRPDTDDHSRGEHGAIVTRRRSRRPIYETTTFVFDNAEEVRAYNEGKSKKFLYSRYGNPTVMAVEQTIARARRGRVGDAAGERDGGDVDRAARPAEDRRRGGVQRRDLRRHAAPAGRSVAALRHHGPLRRRIEELRDARAPARRSHEGAVVRVADQPDAALRRHRRDCRGVPRRAASSRSSTTPSRARSTSSRSRWASTSSCTA